MPMRVGDLGGPPGHDHRDAARRRPGRSTRTASRSPTPGSRCPTSGAGPRRDADGRFAIARVPPGEHRFLARTRDGGEVEGDARRARPTVDLVVGGAGKKAQAMTERAASPRDVPEGLAAPLWRRAAAAGDGCGRDRRRRRPARPRVMLGDLGPMARMGMRRLLGEDGIRGRRRCADGRRASPRRSSGCDRTSSCSISTRRTRSSCASSSASSCPHAKVVLWARTEDVMEVIDPGADAAALGRLRRAGGPAGRAEHPARDPERRNEHAHVPDPRRLRRGGPVNLQADRGGEHLDRRVRRPRARRAGQHADADLELDPVRQDLRRPGGARERAVHGGRLPRALRLRLLPERRQPVLDRARRHGGRRRRVARRRRRCRRRRTAAWRRCAPQALPGVDGQVTVEVVENPDIKDDGTATTSRRARATYNVTVSAPGGASRSTTASRSRRAATTSRPRSTRRPSSSRSRTRARRCRTAQRAPAAGHLHAVGAEPSPSRRSRRRTSPATSPSGAASAASPRSTRSR